MPPPIMPIITAKYAPPSSMACANVSLTVESQHVSVGSNSFAALSHTQKLIFCKPLHMPDTERNAYTNTYWFMGTES